MEAKAQAILDEYGLDFDAYTDEQLREFNSRNIHSTVSDLGDSKSYGTASGLAGHGDIMFILALQRAQIDQNWVLMRQNEQIIRLLEAQNNKDNAKYLDS